MVSKPLGKAIAGSFRLNLNLKVAHLAQDSLDMFMNLRSPVVCYPGDGRSLSIRSSISWNIPLCHHPPCKLEYEPPGMTNQPSAYLGEPRLNACKGPALYCF